MKLEVLVTIELNAGYHVSNILRLQRHSTVARPKCRIGEKYFTIQNPFGPDWQGGRRARHKCAR